MTSESTTQNRYGHENIRRGRAASSRRFIAHPSHRLSASLSHWLSVSRLVLTLAVLLSGGSVAWGQTRYTLNITINGDGDQTKIPLSEFSEYDDNCVVEFNFNNIKDYNIAGHEIGFLRYYDWSDSGLSLTTPSGTINPGENYTIGKYTVGDLKTIAGTKGIHIQLYNAKLLSVVVVVPITDPFLNTPKSGVAFGSGSEEKNKTTDAYGDFTLSAANSVTDFTNIANVKYARIYVTDASGKKLDYDTKADGSNNLLEVVTGGQVAGISKKNGLYVYNGGSNLDLSGITVKLNAGVGNLKKYKVVALLSTDAATTDGSNVTKEPQWDYEYTYTFTYPETVEERVIQLDSELNTGSEIGTNYVALKYRTEAITYLTDEGGVDKDNCYSE